MVDDFKDFFKILYLGDHHLPTQHSHYKEGYEKEFDKKSGFHISKNKEQDLVGPDFKRLSRINFKPCKD